jgi:CRISPR-associated protein Csb2
MPSHLGLTFRFLDPAFHGRRDGGELEWPPSPLRAFQALVAAAAARSRSGGLPLATRSALEWLEVQPPPTVVAPATARGVGRSHSVPNNAMDVVAAAWSRGNDSDTGDASPAKHRTMKAVRATHLVDGDAVHYLWPMPEPIDEAQRQAELLCRMASGVVALGWGIDMVVGHGAILTSEDAEAIAGERWRPGGGTGGRQLRAPRTGTLTALDERHDGFLHRMGAEGFRPPPPLAVYSTVAYQRDGDAAPLSCAAFSLLKLDASGFRAFDAPRRALTVAGMTRHATRRAAEDAGWSEERIRSFVLGHGEANHGDRHVAVGAKRFAYLPLPSIEARGAGDGTSVGSVRRVLLCPFAEGCEQDVAWARRSLSGRELIGEDGEPSALLSLLPTDDRMVRRYTQHASTWATVTPVVLPGHDDTGKYRRRLKRTSRADEQRELLEHLDERVDALLRKAIVHAGYSQTLADHAELEWRKVGFWPGADLAIRYGAPDHLKRFPRLHVRLRWRDAHGHPVEVPGPVCLGAGRFYGLGLLAAVA